MVHPTRGRGRGRGENRVGNSQSIGNMAAQIVNTSQANMSSPPQPKPTQRAVRGNSSNDHCGTCNGITGADAIGCDRCTNWFHPSPMCLGLPDQLITSIQEYGGTGVVFVCTECRTCGGGGGDVSQSAIKQLFQTVKKLCETVQSLTSQVADLSSNPGSTGHQSASGLNPSSAPDTDHLRTLIREETREIEERHKRRQSVIVRGIKAQSVETFKPMFDRVCSYLTGSPVVFSNAMCISKDKHIFRIKIEDDESRKTLLDNARNLRNSSFTDTFINRDLTYKQRGELRARRIQRLNSATSHTQASNSLLNSSPSLVANGAVGGQPIAPAASPDLNH